MANRTACVAAAFVGAIALSGAACNRPPSAPSPPPLERPFSQLEIVGPGTREQYLGGTPAYTVAPGETAQFRAFLKTSNGTNRDVTNEAAWETNHRFALPIAGPGLFTAQQRGQFSVGVRHENLYTSQDVIVMPPETYVVGGRVFESRDPQALVDDAVVTVTSGPGEGQVTGTGTFQQFRLYGLAGPTTIRVIKNGYRTQDVRVTVEGHQMLDIDLPLLTPRVDVAGSYTLTLTAADECEIGLGVNHVPEVARLRSYTAIVSQNGPLLSMELSGASFTDPMKADRRITGRVEPARVTFDLWWGEGNWWFGPPLLVEKLSTGEALLVDGTAETTPSSRSFVGTLNGSFYVYPAGVTPGVGEKTAASCSSSRHRFALTR